MYLYILAHQKNRKMSVCVFVRRSRLANQRDEREIEREREKIKTCLYLRSSLVEDDLHVQDGSKLLLGRRKKKVALLIKETDWWGRGDVVIGSADQ